MTADATPDPSAASTPNPSTPAPSASIPIVVTGTGTATTQPDYALVHFEARVVRPTPTEALSRVTAIATQITAALRSLGIDEDRIVTAPGHIDRERRWEHNAEIVLGWYAHYSVRAQIDDPTTVFTTVLEISAIDDVSIGQPLWQVADDNPARQVARQRAVAAARRSAEHLAEAAGLRLGPITEIREATAGASPLPRMAALGGAAVEAPSHGLETVTAGVTITFGAV